MSSPRRRIRKADAAAPPAAAAKSPAKRANSPAKKKSEDGPSRKAPRTPPKPKGSKTATEVVPPAVDTNARFVTPSISSVVAEEKKSTKKEAAAKSKVRRSLDMGKEPTSSDDDQKQAADNTAPKTKKTPFGNKFTIKVPSNVRRVYEIVSKHTGSIGGNGHGGAIYGELTVGSMQKMTNLMIEYTDLSKESRFIDVGCGLGKPNLHVAQYPGVEFSYGIEMEHVRWMLGMANLDQVLKAAQKDIVYGKKTKKDDDDDSTIEHRCFFAHGDITEANFFDPFTHVYMFDIGFPPRLFHQLAEMFNSSQSEYLICYHGPKLMIERYEFNVDLLVQTPTSMHGSAEGHQGYIYRRTKKANKRKACKTSQFGTPCDPLFAKAWGVCREGLDSVSKYTSEEVEKHMGSKSKRVTRSASKRLFAEEKKEE